MWAWLAACQGPPPPGPETIEARAWGGGEGVRLVLTGDATAELGAPGATASALSGYTRAPEREPCPGDALRWRRGAEGKPLVVACGAPPGAAFQGTAVTGLAVELGDGSMWVDLRLAGPPGHVRAELPFDRKVSLSGTHEAAVDWACLTCGPDGGRKTVGHGALSLAWGFDPAVVRDWSWTKAR
jgi:hypothetical protein